MVIAYAFSPEIIWKAVIMYFFNVLLARESSCKSWDYLGKLDL